MNQRRRARRRRTTPPPGANSRPQSAWRRRLDAWGGLPVIGPLALVIAVVGLLILLNRPSSSVSGAPYVPKLRDSVSRNTWGNPNAPVKIIEFADFQCPFCRRFTEDTEPQLADEFIKTGQVQLIFHNFAFLGPESVSAAAAAECAADQDRFWDYQDILYLRQGVENSGAFSSQHLKEFAQTLHDHFADFDVTKFITCFDGGAKTSLVEDQFRQGRAAGVQTTPSFLINGTLVTGAQDIAVFREAINQALAGIAATPLSTASGTAQ